MIYYGYLLREPLRNAKLAHVDNSCTSHFLVKTLTFSYNWIKLGLNSVYLRNAIPNPTIDVIATRSNFALALFIDLILVDYLHDLLAQIASNRWANVGKWLELLATSHCWQQLK